MADGIGMTAIRGTSSFIPQNGTLEYIQGNMKGQKYMPVACYRPTELCGRSCLRDYCKAHLACLRTDLAHPAMCGEGVKNHFGLCMGQMTRLLRMICLLSSNRILPYYLYVAWHMFCIYHRGNIQDHTHSKFPQDPQVPYKLLSQIEERCPLLIARILTSAQAPTMQSTYCEAFLRLTVQ